MISLPLQHVGCYILGHAVCVCVTALGNLLPALFARILSLQTCH